MGRRVALSALAAAPVEDVPGHSAATLVRLSPAKIAPTPLNKRTNFGTPEELAELGESIRRRQLQPVVVLSRACYLGQYPEHEDRIGSADYVLVNGERRWRAARQAQLRGLDAIIREEIADSRADLLDAVIAENIDRMNLDPVEEANSVEALVAECGSAAAAAKQLHRTEGWVSQRRALLKLTPEIQARVQAGEVAVRIARSIASVPPDDQEAALRKAQARQAGQRAGRRRAPDDPGRQTSGPDPVPPVGPDPVPPPAGPAPPPHQPPGFTAVKNPGEEDAPADHDAANAAAAGEVIPWDSPAALAELIRSKLPAEDLAELVSLLAV